MNTPLNRQLSMIADLGEMRGLATRLAMALANEVAYHGDEDSTGESLAVLALAREYLDLADEFESIDSLRPHAGNRMIAVRCKGATPAVGKVDAKRVVVTLASGKTLTLTATSEPDILICHVSDTMVIHPRTANAVWIELR